LGYGDPGRAARDWVRGDGENPELIPTDLHGVPAALCSPGQRGAW
jgi:hypothetical protein